MKLWILAGIVLCAVLISCVSPVSAQTNPEFRAYWVDAFHTGFKSATDVNNLLAAVRASNMNAVVVQMRRRGDTYYPSNYDPWAQNANQSFDALGYLIQQAHNGSPRIEVHCWFCTMPIWDDQYNAPTSSKHVYNKHPEWLSQDNTGSKWYATSSTGGYYMVDPGVPAAMQYTHDVMMDVVNRYDVDGIHFDIVRYPGNEWGYNPTAVSRFNTLYNRTGTPVYNDSAWLQFRRDQVTALVRKVYVDTWAAKPWVKVSASTIPWGNGPTSDSGWTSTSAYSDVLQDWRAWMQEGILDLNMPMNYDDQSSSTEASYYDHWVTYEKAHKYNRQLAIGMGSYLNTKTNVYHQLNDTRTAATWNNQTYYADGQSFYSYAVPYLNGTGQASSFAGDLVANCYPTSVPVPDMPWKSSPTKGHIRGTAFTTGSAPIDGLTVNLNGTEAGSIKSDGTGYYAFVDLTPGTYTVSGTVGGNYKSATVTVTAGHVVDANLDFSNDPTPPVISGVSTTNLRPYSVDIKWNTDDFSTSQVDYGTTTAYGMTTPLDGATVQSHTVSLDALRPGQLYHFRVRSVNCSGLESVSGDYTFTTFSDTTAPAITNVSVSGITENSAVVTWTTDDYSTSMVQYGLTSAYSQSTDEDTTPVTDHSVLLSNLTPNTVYHFRVKSTNIASLTAYSSDYTFMTLYPSMDVIVDNPDATLTGTWTPSNDNGGWPASSSQFIYTMNAVSSPTATAIWTPNLKATGNYNVYLWYSAGSDRSANVHYSVITASGTVLTSVNQQINGSQWVKIVSSRQFNAGTAGYVKLINNTGDTEGTKKIIADAVKFEYADATADTTAPSVPSGLTATADSASQITVNWAASTDNVGIAGYKVFRGGVLVGNSTTTSYTDTGLAANTQYSYTVSAYDAKMNESAQSSAIGKYTLSTPPTTYIITCTKSASVWYNAGSFMFNNAGFGAGKVTSYRYVWDNSPTHAWYDTESMWTSTSKTLYATTSPSGWYFHVKGYNVDGIGNGTLDLGPYYFDTDLPVMNQVSAPKYLPIHGDNYGDLTANWAGTDASSGVAEYQYAIGTTTGGTDILGWTSAGTNTSASCHYAGALSHSYSYYWSVKAKDAAGNWSAITTSSPSIYTNAYATIAEAMKNPDTTPVFIDPALVVSATFGNYSYVQETGRSRGLRLAYCDAGWQPGTIVSIAGVLNTISGERQLTQIECRAQTNGTSAPYPLGMAASKIGGMAPDQYTTGLDGAAGLYNVGLLIRTAGGVTSHGTGWFILDDGSGATVKVYSDKFVNDGTDFVGVTGIAGIESGQRIIKTRNQADVQIYPQ